MTEPPARREHPVAPLELFFDLVFVFAFTQVTTVLSDNPTWSGLGHALLILTALWWAWAAYAWLTNTIDPENSGVWAAMLTGAGAMFVAALAVPEVFGRHGVVFGVAFLVANVMQETLYSIGARGDKDLTAAIARTAPTALAGAAIILAAGFVDGALRAVLWLVALLVGLLLPLFQGTRGWHVQPGHFVERHGLIVLIAIGESLVAIGLGARRTALGGDVILAAVLGFLVATAFWLAYFDYFPMRAQQLLERSSPGERIALARDVYTYLHLPMVAGIVLLAFALKTTLAHVHDELATIPALALCGGSALFLSAFVGVRVRVSRSLGRGRLLAGIACLLLLPVALAVPALAALALVAAVWAALHVYELVWFRQARAESRALRTG